MKEFYTIGEFCNLFSIDKQTLRYYDKIGLMSPNKRDRITGWRYYELDQVYQLASIRFMRKLGYSIEEIKKLFETSNIEHSLNSLKEHSAVIRKEWQRILSVDNIIQRKLLFIENKLLSFDPAMISVKWYPERKYILIGQEENLYFDEDFYCYPTVVFYNGEEKSFGVYVDSSIDGISEISYENNSIKLHSIPAGNFLCGYHVGSYSGVTERYKEIAKEKINYSFKKPNYHINFNVIDQFVVKDSSKFITEIQIPLEAPLQ